MELFYKPYISKVLRCGSCITRDDTVLPATHTRTIPVPAFTPLLEGITSLRLVLIGPTQEGMARLSLPGLLVTYRDKCPHRELNPDTITHSSTNWAQLS